MSRASSGAHNRIRQQRRCRLSAFGGARSLARIATPRATHCCTRRLQAGKHFTPHNSLPPAKVSRCYCVGRSESLAHTFRTRTAHNSVGRTKRPNLIVSDATDEPKRLNWYYCFGAKFLRSIYFSSSLQIGTQTIEYVILAIEKLVHYKQHNNKLNRINKSKQTAPSSRKGGSLIGPSDRLSIAQTLSRNLFCCQPLPKQMHTCKSNAQSPPLSTTPIS